MEQTSVGHLMVQLSQLGHHASANVMKLIWLRDSQPVTLRHVPAHLRLGLTVTLTMLVKHLMELDGKAQKTLSA